MTLKETWQRIAGIVAGGAAILPSIAHAQDEAGFDSSAILKSVEEHAAPWAMNIGGALLMLFVGWLVAGWLSRTVRKAGSKKNFDPTLTKFFSNLVRYLVLTAVILGVVGKFGIQTSSFAALIGAAGLAVGLAFEGTLANFAAGLMLLVFRPFKVEDLVEISGVLGIVEEIELFTTVIKTLDNQKIIVPNKKIFGETIRNIGGYETRRVDIDVGCDYGAEIDACRAALEECVGLVEKKISEPAPQIFLSGLGASSVDWQVRVWCKTEDYWDVYQSTIRAIHMTLGKHDIGIPFPQMDVHLDNQAVAALAKR